MLSNIVQILLAWLWPGVSVFGVVKKPCFGFSFSSISLSQAEVSVVTLQVCVSCSDVRCLCVGFRTWQTSTWRDIPACQSTLMLSWRGTRSDSVWNCLLRPTSVMHMLMHLTSLLSVYPRCALTLKVLTSKFIFGVQLTSASWYIKVIQSRSRSSCQCHVCGWSVVSCHCATLSTVTWHFPWCSVHRVSVMWHFPWCSVCSGESWASASIGSWHSLLSAQCSV